jgi:hypothetical protein
MVDVGRKGLSLDERSCYPSNQAGATSGVIAVDCVVLNRSYEGQACQFTLLPRTGR